MPYAETLLYCALIAYIIFEAPAEDRNINTLVDMISGMDVKEDDESYMNAVDYMFKGLGKRKPDCFAVKQYKKYKLASGVITSKSSFNTGDNKVRVEAILRGFYIAKKGGRCYDERQHYSLVRTSVPRRRASG